MTDETIILKVNVETDCDGTDYYQLLTEQGYQFALVDPEAVKAHGLEHGQRFVLQPEAEFNTPPRYIQEALNSGDGTYKP